MSVLRSIAAVVLGYLVFAVSAGLLFPILGADPHAPQRPGLIAGSVVYGMAFAFVGGLAAIRLAPRRPGLHAALVSLLIAAGAAASLLASPANDAKWSQRAALLLMAPSALLAGRLSTRRAPGGSPDRPAG
jgi:hypothetical protein